MSTGEEQTRGDEDDKKDGVRKVEKEKEHRDRLPTARQRAHDFLTNLPCRM